MKDLAKLLTIHMVYALVMDLNQLALKLGFQVFESGLVKWDLGRLKQVFVNTDLWNSESFFWLYPVN